MSPDPILDRALELARAESPPRLDPGRARRMVERALQQRDAGTTERAFRGRWLAWLAIPAAAAVALWLALPSPRPAPVASAAPSELVLPTGDRIASVPGTRLDVTEATAARRAIRLTDGEVLFDVRPLAAGEQFVVHTPDTDVIVTGTVFTVEVAAGATTVRVYEGHVRARRGGIDHALPAGHQLGPGGGIAALARDPLGTLATEYARARLATRTEPAPALALGDDAPAADRAPPPRVDPTTSDASPRAASTQAPVRDDAPPRRDPSTSTPDLDTATLDRPGLEPAPAVPAPADRTAAAETAEPRADRAQVVALLAAGKHAAARDLARANQWHVLEGDAHRGLGAHALAAEAYERALLSADRDEACIGALRAARLYADPLAKPARAFELLEHAAIPACPTRERALAHAIQLATRLARPELGREAARRYLAAYPQGDSAGAARALLAP